MTASPITVFVFAFSVSLFLISLIRVIFHLRIARLSKKYESLVEERMAVLKQDIQDRTKQLHDSMQVINHEYQSLFKQAKDIRQQSTETLAKTVDIAQKKQRERQDAAIEEIMNKVQASNDQGNGGSDQENDGSDSTKSPD